MFKLPNIILRDNFLLSYFEQNRISSFYKGFEQGLPSSGKPRGIIEEAPLDRITVINCIPPYLEDITTSLNPGFARTSRYYRSGYSLELINYEKTEDYWRDVLGSKQLKKIRRDFRKLNAHEDLRFKVYYGNIDYSHYNQLMGSLKYMIKSRFAEKSMTHSALSRWDFFLRSTFDKINFKKASLFVYSTKCEPICIGLNYHHNDILFSAITSFNSNYSNLGPGKLMLFKRVTWCLANDYTIIDLGYGDFSWKKKVSNLIYKYRTDIIYPEKQRFKKLIAFVLGYLLERKYQHSTRNINL